MSSPKVTTNITSFKAQKTIDHAYLTKCAVRWLTNTQHCSVVISEISSAAGEQPDAIGWKYGSSTLVECKISRSDLQANANKCHIRADNGMGTQRYIMVPAGLISAEDFSAIEHCRGWGLLWLSPSSEVRVQRQPERRDPNHQKEICVLTSALRRMRTREFITIVQATQEDRGDADAAVEAYLEGLKGEG